MNDIAGFRTELAEWIDAEATWRDARALEFAADPRNASHAAALRRLAADILAMSTSDPRLVQLAQFPRRHFGRLERLIRKTLFAHPDDGVNFDHFFGRMVEAARQDARDVPEGSRR